MDKKNNDKKIEIIIGIVFAVFIIGMITFVLNRNDRKADNYSSKTDFDEILNEYSIIKQESLPSIKASLDIRLNREFNKSSIEKLAQKLKNDLKGDYERIFICYYLPGMKVGSGAWATSHFDPDLKIIMTAPYYDDTKKITKTDNSKSDKLINKFLTENGSVDILGKWSQGDGVMVVIFKKNGNYYLNEMEIDNLKIGKNWDLDYKNKNGKQIFIIKALMGEGYYDYYLIEKNGKLSLYNNIGIYEQYDLVE